MMYNDIGEGHKKETDDSVSFYINGKSDYLMFGFSLFHSATGGRTPIAITSSRSAHNVRSSYPKQLVLLQYRSKQRSGNRQQ